MASPGRQKAARPAKRKKPANRSSDDDEEKEEDEEGDEVIDLSSPTAVGPLDCMLTQ